MKYKGWKKRGTGIVLGVFCLSVFLGGCSLLDKIDEKANEKVDEFFSSDTQELEDKDSVRVKPLPTPLPTSTPVPTLSPKPTETPVPTPIPTATPTPAPSPSVLPTPTPGITGTPTPTPAAAGGDYILPESSSRYLTREEVSGLNYEQKQMAINEIYARHGYRFTMKEVQDYFNQKSWYQGTVDLANVSESVFNQYEAANIQLLNQ